MDYNKHYYNLINRAKSRVLEGYVEKHHIIPKCLGGTDDFDNLVVLTAEEHFVAHQLLTKIYPNNEKLIYAVSMMCVKTTKQQRNNKMYGWLKRKYYLAQRTIKKQKYKKESKPRKPRAKETKPRKKRLLSDEHKKKIGLASLGRTKSKETKKLISENSSKALQEKKKILGYVRSYTPKRINL